MSNSGSFENTSNTIFFTNYIFHICINWIKWVIMPLNPNKQPSIKYTEHFNVFIVFTTVLIGHNHHFLRE